MDGLLKLRAQLEGADYDYNPWLRDWKRAEPNHRAGEGQIQDPAKPTDIIWQNRSASPTEAENALGDALEEVLDEGAETLGEIVKGLNGRNLLAPDGSAWTEQSLAAEFHRLGA